MPLAWCGAADLPGSTVKSGSSDSATFIRNVPEPHLYAAMRARKSSGRCSGATSSSNRSFGLTFATTREARRASPLASVTPAARPPSTITERTAESVRSVTPRAAHSFAIASVIAPMPPRACPHWPRLPFTSPKTWCSST